MWWNRFKRFWGKTSSRFKSVFYIILKRLPVSTWNNIQNDARVSNLFSLFQLYPVIVLTSLSICRLILIIAAVQNVEPSAEKSIKLSEEVDSLSIKIAAIWSYVTFINVFYCLTFLYLIIMMSFAINYFKKIKANLPYDFDVWLAIL